MSKNSCLRPACVSDVPGFWGLPPHSGSMNHSLAPIRIEQEALRRLYDAEWRKRGFERSP